MKIEYQAPWETRVKIMTVLVVVLLVGVAIMPFIFRRDLPPVAQVLSVVVPLVILISVAMFGVRSYTLTEKALIIRHLLWSKRFLLDGLENAYSDPFAMMASWRVFGIGGMFGFIGYYQNKELGRYRAYVTDAQRSVILRFKEGTIVISPHDPGGFLKELDRITGTSPET